MIKLFSLWPFCNK